MSRLPLPGNDEGIWGDILNDYLLNEHNPDGTHKSQYYIKPNPGIPISDLEVPTQDKINKALQPDDIYINVLDHGALGDGTTDDTAAFQESINIAKEKGGTVYIPGTANGYRITSTLLIEPSSGSQVYVNFLGEGKATTLIRWAGGNNTAVFRSYGWKTSKIHGVKIQTDSNQSGLVAWELDADGVRNSTTDLTFENCFISFGSGSNCIGWRGGATQDGDLSFLTFINCRVRSAGSSTGSIGWNPIRPNCLGWQWLGCSSVAMGKGFSNRGGAQNGGASMHFYSMNSSSNDVDFEFVSQGSYSIHGGRFELGKRFLDAGGSGGTFSQIVNINGVTLAGYRPTDSILFNISTYASVVVDGLTLYDSANTSDYGAATFTATAAKGSLILRNSAIQGSMPIQTITSNEFIFRAQNLQRRGLSGAMVSVLADKPPTLLSRIRSLGPIAYWKLDETSGTAISDSSGNGRNGTSTGGTIGIAGVERRAFNFGGSSSTINVYSAGLASAFTSNLFTICLWARTTSWTDGVNTRVLQFQADAQNRLLIYRETGVNNEIRALYVGSNATTLMQATGMTTLDWFHLAVVIDSTANTGTLYINGTRIDTKNITTVWNSAITAANLGSTSGSTGNTWTGALDEVAVFSKALTEDEILMIYRFQN